MKNPTQLQRYKKLLAFLETHFLEDISAKQMEDICFYSYRNINRIFCALQGQSIGQYIKRLRLEKAATYLKYSDEKIVTIAYSIGYADIATFSKAFKKHFKCAPLQYRNRQKARLDITQDIFKEKTTKPLDFIQEDLPEFYILYLPYYGDYQNIKAIEKTWKTFLRYTKKVKIAHEKSIFLAEILDDNAITDSVFCRYHAGIILEKEPDFIPEGLFAIKKIPARSYIKCIHKGSHKNAIETYTKIYARWLLDIPYALADAPTLEFYLNDTDTVKEKDLLTEIYIPIEKNQKQTY